MDDGAIKEQMAANAPYGEWIENNLVDLESWVADAKPVVDNFNFDESNRRFNMFGYTTETVGGLVRLTNHRRRAPPSSPLNLPLHPFNNLDHVSPLFVF